MQLSSADMEWLIQLDTRVQEAERIAIFGHRNIDWDAVWSCLAIGTLLQNMGKKVFYYCPTPPSPIFDFIPEVSSFSQKLPESSEVLPSFDIIFFMDTGDTVNQLGHFRNERPQEFEQHPRKVVIDHHKSNNGYGNLNFINAEASSACEYLTNLLLAWEKTDTHRPEISSKITPQIASYLLLGISTDTGNFMYERDSKNTFEAASSLLQLGADKENIVTNMYRKNSPKKLQFLWTLLSRIAFEWGVISSRCSKAELAAEQLEEEVGDLFLSLFTTIEHNGIFAFFKIDEAAQMIRCSLRTKNPQIDVSQIAAHCNGGWHKFAAGCRFELSPFETEHQVSLKKAIAILNELMS